MTERNIGQEILEGIREIKTHKKGQIHLRTNMLKKTRFTQIHSKKAEFIAICICRFNGR
jgi:hypothetical protein